MWRFKIYATLNDILPERRDNFIGWQSRFAEWKVPVAVEWRRIVIAHSGLVELLFRNGFVS